MKSSSSECPVDSSRVTEGPGIPDTDLDRLIAATLPDADPTPPAGADPAHVDDWDREGYRLVWSPPMPLPAELDTEDVRVVVTQMRDGRIATEGWEAPLIYVGVADQWAGVTQVVK